ncbi:hypothetical protein EV195_101165 [Tenacibaculum skagerrakense]|uniref:Uncharacterized protein n=1 Tax=Tenacibaculum skagerrakense TaxID=186571 RepID=A0A4V2SMN8_9FLAO|nr:hypothetical protein EV195_101165 [Tenacibaculum skagerrakense]
MFNIKNVKNSKNAVNIRLELPKKWTSDFGFNEEIIDCFWD